MTNMAIRREEPYIGLGVVVILLMFLAWYIHYGCACELMPVKEGGRVEQSEGMITKRSTSIGHCIAQCFKIEECTGVNYLRRKRLCEMLYQPVDDGTMTSYNSSIHVTMIRGTALGALRVSDGPSERGGRVEMFYNGIWGRICDDGWNEQNAEVVCKRLGFCNGRPRLGSAYPGGTGPIHQHSVQCHGHETSLLDCQSEDGPGRCAENANAGVLCTTCDVRIVDGTSHREGRVEVMVNGSMGTICDDGWDDRDATVVCREMGYCTGIAKHAAFFGPGVGPIHLDNVACDGNEKSVLECTAIGEAQQNCDHTEDVGVQCFFDYPCLRLVDGKNPMEGRVEVFMDNQWGTVCDDKWNAINTAVVCRQLGYCPGDTTDANFVSGKGEIFFDDVQCVGDEWSLIACPRSPDNHNCGHTEDVDVVCSKCSE